MALERISYRPRNRGERSLVQNVICALTHFANTFSIQKVDFAEFDLSLKSRKVFALAGLEVVETAYRLSAADEFLREIGSNKAGNSGY
jgi:hypothetical protein